MTFSGCVITLRTWTFMVTYSEESFSFLNYTCLNIFALGGESKIDIFNIAKHP